MSVFYATLDIIVAQVARRFDSMREVARRFGFLRPQELVSRSDSELYKSASTLAEQYSDDLSGDFPDQILAFRSALGPVLKKLMEGYEIWRALSL